MLFFFQFINKSQAQEIKRLNGSIISSASLDEKIKTLMSAANVHGLAVSVFNNNKPVYKKTFGYKLFTKAYICVYTHQKMA